MNVITEAMPLDDATQDTRSLAEFFTDAFVLLDGKQIPQQVRARCILCVVDTLGVAIAAVGRDVGTAAARVVLQSGSGPCAVWGSGRGVSMADAALANGMLSHALDFDDTHAAAIMHTSCMVVPVVVAMGQAQGHSGRDILDAAIVGYEVAGRLGRLAPGIFQYKGFQATAVLGVFACVASAARLMKLDRAQTVNAFGIAGSMAGGLMEYLANGSDVKQLHAGWSAQAGIRAVQLAAEGFTGPPTVFEGRFGVFKSFIQQDIDVQAVKRFAPDTWEVELMGPKPYPACLCVHPLVQAMLQTKPQLLAQGASLDDIHNIHCQVPQWYVDLIFEPAAAKVKPSTPYEARFSGPYCIARALLEDELTLDSFEPAKIADADAARLGAKVTYEVAALPEFPEAFPARVITTLKDGQKIETYIHHNLGSPGNPLTPAQYDDKFLTATRSCLAPEQAQQLLVAIKCLQQPDGMGNLTRVLESLTLI